MERHVPGADYGCTEAYGPLFTVATGIPAIPFRDKTYLKGRRRDGQPTAPHSTCSVVNLSSMRNALVSFFFYAIFVIILFNTVEGKLYF